MDILDRINDHNARIFQEGLVQAAERHGMPVDKEAGDMKGLQERAQQIQVETPAVEMELDSTFFEGDIRESLDRITAMLRGLRNDHRTKKEELVPLKAFRARFSALLSRTKAKGIESSDIKEGSALLDEFAVYEAQQMK